MKRRPLVVFLVCMLFTSCGQASAEASLTAPDEIVPGQEGQEGPAIQAGVDWLLRQPACAAGN